MVEVVYHNKAFILPESYNELTGDQLIALAPLLRGDMDPLQRRLLVLRVLMNVSLTSFYFQSLDMRGKMIGLTDWVFKENTLTEQLLPWVGGLYGPKSCFDNLTLSEYHCTEVFYAQLVENPDGKCLDALVGILYRKPKLFYNSLKDPDGDIRKPFNEHEIDYMAARVAKRLTPNEKLAILLWYDGCRQHLIGLYPKVFKSGSGGGEESMKGMFGIMRQLAGATKYGAFDQVKQLNLHTALMEFEQMIDEAEALKKPTTA